MDSHIHPPAPSADVDRFVIPEDSWGYWFCDWFWYLRYLEMLLWFSSRGPFRRANFCFLNRLLLFAGSVGRMSYTRSVVEKDESIRSAIIVGLCLLYLLEGMSRAVEKQKAFDSVLANSASSQLCSFLTGLYLAPMLCPSLGQVYWEAFLAPLMFYHIGHWPVTFLIRMNATLESAARILRRPLRRWYRKLTKANEIAWYRSEMARLERDARVYENWGYDQQKTLALARSALASWKRHDCVRRFEEGTLQEGESEINPEDEILDTRPPSPENYS